MLWAAWRRFPPNRTHKTYCQHHSRGAFGICGRATQAYWVSWMGKDSHFGRRCHGQMLGAGHNFRRPRCLRCSPTLGHRVIRAKKQRSLAVPVPSRWPMGGPAEGSQSREVSRLMLRWVIVPVILRRGTNRKSIVRRFPRLRSTRGAGSQGGFRWLGIEVLRW